MYNRIGSEFVWYVESAVYASTNIKTNSGTDYMYREREENKNKKKRKFMRKKWTWYIIHLLHEMKYINSNVENVLSEQNHLCQKGIRFAFFANTVYSAPFFFLRRFQLLLLLCDLLFGEQWFSTFKLHF